MEQKYYYKILCSIEWSRLAKISNLAHAWVEASTINRLAIWCIEVMASRQKHMRSELSREQGNAYNGYTLMRVYLQFNILSFCIIMWDVAFCYPQYLGRERRRIFFWRCVRWWFWGGTGQWRVVRQRLVRPRTRGCWGRRRPLRRRRCFAASEQAKAQAQVPFQLKNYCWAFIRLIRLKSKFQIQMHSNVQITFLLPVS